MQNISVVEYVSESQELRSNTWTFCIYPESMPNDYLQIIGSWCIPTLLSPVHNSDLNGNGMEKKEHIHVLMYFGKGANKSYLQVMKFVEKLHGCPCEVVHNSVGLIRYFIHKDNPEKHQYSIDDMRSFFGFEYLSAFQNNLIDEDRFFNFIEEFCEDNRIYNYYQLTLLLKRDNLLSELNFLRHHSTHIRFFLTDKYQIMKRLGMLQQLDESFAYPDVYKNQ